MAASGFIFRFSVSLAHRYWDKSLSLEGNRAQFGSFAAPMGVGANLAIEVEVHEGDSTVPHQIKKDLDHRSFEGLSTLELLTLEIAQKYEVQLRTVKVSESERLTCHWSKDQKDLLALWWRRPLSWIWQRCDGGWGGARTRAEFGFQCPIQELKSVCVSRAFLEEEFEEFLSGRERDGWQVPAPVNWKAPFLDALLKDCASLRHRPFSLRLEVEREKKWLIRP